MLSRYGLDKPETFSNDEDEDDLNLPPNSN